MAIEPVKTEHIHSYCALCISRCGAVATIEDDRFVALKADPTHPTGQALCIKGRVAPELVYSPDRLLYPIKRTNPKTNPDPGWQRISWSEALETIATKLKALADQHGPETVVFNTVSPSTSALVDSVDWVRRLRHAFGSPNQSISMELCGWGRYLANVYSYGASLPAVYMPDIENAGCILFWGYNPTVSRIAHATATVAAQKRGAKLIVVDPRQAGLARKADHWLRVRPGSDGALALGLAHVMIEQGWYDEKFVRQWTDGPLLVRSDNGKMLRQNDITAGGNPETYVAWDANTDQVTYYDPATGGYLTEHANLALTGTIEVETIDGVIACRPSFQLVVELCARHDPATVEKITGIAAAQVKETAKMLWAARPVAYMAWSGLEQQTNATQVARAIGLVYALTGNFDAKGGNVLFPTAASNDIQGLDMLTAEQREKTLGLKDRPLGLARFDFVTSSEIYRGILDHQPYAVHGLVSFGSNLLVAHANGERGRKALAALDFHVHIDLFMNPTAELADIVLPTTTPFEAEGLKVGFEISEAAASLVQLRKKLVEPRGEARSDIQIVFDLACEMGLGGYFWHGDIDAAYRHQLAPSGVKLETLRENPAGVRVPVDTQYRKYSALNDGKPQGFETPSRKIELYSETLLIHGYAPLPDYEEPLVGPLTRPDLIDKYPLVLTCAKSSIYCESQHRGLPSLRRRALEPEVELHPDAAAARNIDENDWVHIETPNGRVRARAVFNNALDPQVVCGQHGWWQACPELDAPAYEPFGRDSANFNLIIGDEDIDPVSGSIPLHAYLCQVEKLA